MLVLLSKAYMAVMRTHVVSEKVVAATRAVIGIVARVSLGLTTVAVTTVVHRSASRCPMLWLLLFVVKVDIADVMAIHVVDSTPPQRAATLATAARCVAVWRDGSHESTDVRDVWLLVG